MKNYEIKESLDKINLYLEHLVLLLPEDDRRELYTKLIRLDDLQYEKRMGEDA